MLANKKRLVECRTCYTLIAYLNGVCPACGGAGFVEEKDPPAPIMPKGKAEPKSA
jgi:hypothetical protein